jgi:glycosyltransferase involved in cell wall biosynthesis
MKISVVIATKDRLEDLRTAITKYLDQTYKDIEIIVIDNASNDQTKEKIPVEFPTVKYIWLPDNIDIRAINYGISLATGDVIWRCDDDSHPRDNDAFEKVVKILTDNSDIDIIASENVEVKRGYLIWEWYPIKVDKVNIPAKGYKSHMFPGSGAAIRKEVFEKIGYFWDFGFEELDFCARAIRAGLSVRYFPNIVTYHHAAPGNRIHYDRWIKMSCQFLRLQWTYFPFCRAVGRSTIIILSQLIIAIQGFYNPFVILEGLMMMNATIIKTFRSERNPMTKEQLNDITMGANLLKNQYVFFKQKIVGALNRWKNKK